MTVAAVLYKLVIMINKLKLYRIFVFICLLGWAVMIFSLSAESADESAETSGGLVEKIIAFLFPDFDSLSEAAKQKMLDLISFIVRKAAHFTIYAVLGVLALLNTITFKSIALKYRVLIASLFSLIYAVGDELHQLYVPGRSGEIRDVFIDFSGALSGVVVLLVFKKLCRLQIIKKYT